MNAELGAFLKQYAAIEDDDLKIITGNFKKHLFKKNSFLLKKGAVCSDLIYVREGCVRLYYISEEVEVSVWFAFSNSSAIEISSFISEKPSEYFLQAIEDTEVWTLPKSTLTQLYTSNPVMQEVMRNYWEDVVMNLINRFTALQRDSAEQRYRDLLAKPPYLQKIPQKFLASFIGVTPSSLSRIRKSIR